MNTTKRILYISYDGMTDPLGQSQVIPYLQQLTLFGYQFTILSVEKKERLRKSGAAVALLLERSGIEWNTLLFSSRPPLLSKWMDQQRVNATAARLHRARPFDMVHCRSYVAAAAAIKLYDRFRLPFLFDMRGFWVDERVDNGQWNLRSSLYRYLYKVYKRKEKRYLADAKKIISLTLKGKEEMINAYGVKAEKIEVIPCCTDLSHFDYHRISSEAKARTLQQLGVKEGRPVVSYLGSLGGWYLTEEMLDFFACLKAKIPAAVFLFISHNDPAEILEKAATRGIVSSDIIVCPASRDEVPAHLAVSDWNIFFIKNAYSKRASSPTKQGEVMGMGIPVICNAIGDTGMIIAETGAGYLVDAFTTNAYNEVVERILTQPVPQAETIRQGALRFYDLKMGVQKYNAVYQEVLS